MDSELCLHKRCGMGSALSLARAIPRNPKILQRAPKSLPLWVRTKPFSTVSNFLQRNQATICLREKESSAKSRDGGTFVFDCNRGQETVLELVFSSSLSITSTICRQWKKKPLTQPRQTLIHHGAVGSCHCNLRVTPAAIPCPCLTPS